MQLMFHMYWVHCTLDLENLSGQCLGMVKYGIVGKSITIQNGMIGFMVKGVSKPSKRVIPPLFPLNNTFSYKAFHCLLDF